LPPRTHPQARANVTMRQHPEISLFSGGQEGEPARGKRRVEIGVLGPRKGRLLCSYMQLTWTSLVEQEKCVLLQCG
jgi:hypothetical protein